MLVFCVVLLGLCLLFNQVQVCQDFVFYQCLLLLIVVIDDFGQNLVCDCWVFDLFFGVILVIILEILYVVELVCEVYQCGCMVILYMLMDLVGGFYVWWLELIQEECVWWLDVVLVKVLFVQGLNNYEGSCMIVVCLVMVWFVEEFQCCGLYLVDSCISVVIVVVSEVQWIGLVSVLCDVFFDNEVILEVVFV